jgi:hypothetical protein
MDFFQTLGEKVEQLWRDKNFDETIFPVIAAEALESAGLPDKISVWDVIEWTLKQNVLPDQRDLHGRFGDPPITLYNSTRFHIDLYFWLEGTTSIHQHGFCGAFQVMHGSSLHSHYEFNSHDQVNVFTEIGEMNLLTVDFLEVGMVRKILAGRQYIHGLFHLDHPSATIVVRTHKIPVALPQYSYYKPSLAIDPFFDEPNTIKKLQCLSALFRTNHPNTDKIISNLLEESDFQTTFTVLSTVNDFLQSNQLEQMFNTGSSEKRFEALMEIVRKRHGNRAEVFPKIFAHQEKVNEIIKRRNFVKEPEHRFFLALLMNVEGKQRILSLVRKRFPEADPIEKILDWTFDLAQTRVLGLNLPNALGIADFGDLDLFILENILKDKSDEELRTALITEYLNEDVEALAKSLTEKKERIKQSVIIAPLLQTV